MEVRFSEVSIAGIRREFPDKSKQEWCKVSLSFYLRRDHDKTSVRCNAFPDLQTYVYSFGLKYRVLYEVRHEGVLVWNFRIATSSQ